MKALAVIFVIICSFILAIMGGLLIAFSFNLVSVRTLWVVISQNLKGQNINLIIGGIGLFLVIASVSLVQIAIGKVQREKTIAFNNPDGQVTVSLTAIEEFIKRLASSITEVKDLRSSVTAGKKGIEIDTRVTLWADANIPQTTENIQAIIKNRIQEMLGIEENIEVRVHISKIIKKEKKSAKKRDEASKPAPFRGSIEYGKD
jgi:uncharacterized alkaline shock family protein YloU